jgi:hypothetical protein
MHRNQVERNLEHVRSFAELLTVEVFDRAAAEEFGKIQAELRQLARPAGVMDSLIAAVARSGDVVGSLVETAYWQGVELRSRSEIINPCSLRKIDRCDVILKVLGVRTIGKLK